MILNHKAVILCVDDEKNALVLRKLLLQRAGYDVITATSASEALEIVKTRSIDVLLSDHLMPGITGAELARRIKSQYPGVRVILLSGVNELPAEAAAADVFLSKVEGPDRLCQAITALLNSPAESDT